MQIPKQKEIGFSRKVEICCAFPATQCKWNSSIGFVCAFFRAFLFPNGRRLTPKSSRVSRVGDTLGDTLAHTLDIPLTKTRYSSPDRPIDCFETTAYRGSKTTRPKERVLYPTRCGCAQNERIRMSEFRPRSAMLSRRSAGERAGCSRPLPHTHPASR